MVEVVETVQDSTGPHGDLVGCYQRRQELGSAGSGFFGGGENRREDYRARMAFHRAVAVVYVQRRSGEAVGERRANRHATRVGADDGG